MFPKEGIAIADSVANTTLHPSCLTFSPPHYPQASRTLCLQLARFSYWIMTDEPAGRIELHSAAPKARCLSVQFPQPSKRSPALIRGLISHGEAEISNTVAPYRNGQSQCWEVCATLRHSGTGRGSDCELHVQPRIAFVAHY